VRRFLVSVVALGAVVLSATDPVRSAESTSAVAAWGLNGNGQVGDGTSGNARVNAVTVNGLTDVAAVAGGYLHSLALKRDGTVWAWGDNSFGQLGNGTTMPSLVPVKVSSLTNVTAVAANSHFSFALRSDGTLWSWGANYFGQLGDGTGEQRTLPVRVVGLTSVRSVAAGWQHALAVENDGSVWAWGWNYYGQLGNGTTSPFSFGSPTPARVQGIQGTVSVADGYGHSLALDASGNVWAWGANDQGQLGDGSGADHTLPVQVSSLSGVSTISSKYFHSYALKATDGTVWSWGSNFAGQLGDGSFVTRTQPVRVVGLTGVRSVAAGASHGLALMQDGTVRSWGQNSWGQLGDGTFVDRTGPVSVAGLTNVSTIAAGFGHSLATFNMTPADSTPPTITAPANITTATDPGQCTAVVSFAFSANDDSGSVSVTSAPPSGSSFPKGTTLVTGTATDPSGNSSTASFSITVNDVEPPAIAAPANISVVAAGATGTVVPDPGSPTFSDNCPGASATVSGTPVGNLFPIGVTTLTWTAVDASGNSAAATQTVTVSYNVCLLYDPTKAAMLGSTVPIRLQLCTLSGSNLSTPSLIPHATTVIMTGPATSVVADDAGNANPDSDFRYDVTLGGTGGYVYNLSTKGLSSGSWRISFTVGGQAYGAPFQVK